MPRRLAACASMLSMQVAPMTPGVQFAQTLMLYLRTRDIVMDAARIKSSGF